MAESPPFSSKQNQPEDLQQLAARVEAAAQKRSGDSMALLALLRLLEQLHREIRENLFRDALPTNRQRLYALLRDIEVNGGWPYIQRMKLAVLLQSLLELEAENAEDAAAE